MLVVGLVWTLISLSKKRKQQKVKQVTRPVVVSEIKTIPTKTGPRY